MKRSENIVATTVFSFLLCVALPALADFKSGREAYVLKDYDKAIMEFKKGNDPKAQYQLGYIYEHGEGVPQDIKEAAVWYRKAAEQGHPKAQYRMGLFYENGAAVEKDLKEATKWYRKSADQNFPAAKDAVKRVEKVWRAERAEKAEKAQ
jgi:uncharacterized protein